MSAVFQDRPWDVHRLPPAEASSFPVTGGNTGIGYFAAEQLATTGALVVIGGRDRARAATAVASTGSRVPDARVRHLRLDLGDLQSARDYWPKRTYGRSKPAQMRFGFERDRRLRAVGSSVLSVVAPPGGARRAGHVCLSVAPRPRALHPACREGSCGGRGSADCAAALDVNPFPRTWPAPASPLTCGPPAGNCSASIRTPAFGRRADRLGARHCCRAGAADGDRLPPDEIPALVGSTR